MSFVIEQMINRINTMTLVKVVKCTNTGGLSPVGFVDVVSLVTQLDGQGNPVPHDTIFGLPYVRIQGGANAIIIDPEVGDIGVAGFAGRDLSKVKATKAEALPGSNRKYSMSDGIYFGGTLNGTPTQYVQFNSSGITIHSPTKITVSAPVVEVNASTSATVTTATATINASTSATIATPQAVVNASTTMDITSPATTIHGPLTVTGGITGQAGAVITGLVDVTGKVTASDTIESLTSLKVNGVTLTVP
jgi:hypothetical protein